MELEKDINSFCRLCLTEDLKEPHHIFEEVLSSKIIILTQLDVQVSDNLPKFVCKECRYQLEKAHFMRLKAKQCDVKFRKHIRLINQNKPSNILNKDYKDDDLEEIDEILLESNNYFDKVENEIKKLKDQFEKEKSKIIKLEVQRALKLGKKSAKGKSSTRKIPKNPIVLNKLAPPPTSQTNSAIINEIGFDSIEIEICNEKEFLSNPQIVSIENVDEESEIQFYEIAEVDENELKPIKDVNSSAKFSSVNDGNYWRAIEDVKTAELDNNGEKKIFQCAFENCKESFARRQACKTHYFNHLTKQVIPSGFVCKYCEKTFKVISALQRHERIHSGDKPFKCDFEGCSKAFNQKEMLKRHSLIHSAIEDAPFKCKSCEKRFRQTGALKLHIAKEHSEDVQNINPHICQICQRSFAHSSGLSRHLLIHSGKSFSCEICGKVFNDKSSMKRHVNVHDKS